ASYISNGWVVFFHFLQLFQRVVPHCSRMFNHSFFLEDINGCTCCSASYRVSAESCTMAANFPFRHQFLGCYGCTEGQSASYSFRDRHNIRRSPKPASGKPVPCSPKTGLHLIENQ